MSAHRPSRPRCVICVCVCAYIHTCIHTCIHTYIRITGVSRGAYAMHAYMHIYTCIHAHLRSRPRCVRVFVRSDGAQIYTHVHYIYIYIYIYISWACTYYMSPVLCLSSMCLVSVLHVSRVCLACVSCLSSNVSCLSCMCLVSVLHVSEANLYTSRYTKLNTNIRPVS